MHAVLRTVPKVSSTAGTIILRGKDRRSLQLLSSLLHGKYRGRMRVPYQYLCTQPNSSTISAYENVEIVEDKKSKKRKRQIREHVNPLAGNHQQVLSLPQTWISDTFADPTLPFVLDIGCAKGAWALEYAKANQSVNVLGLDIRQPIIDVAMKRKAVFDLENLHFLTTNANVNIKQIISSIETSSSIGVELIAINFPDPYFKPKQQKRRLLNEKFLQDFIDSGIRTGTKVAVQTDVAELMEYMMEVLKQNSLFVPCEGYQYSNPFDLSPSLSNPKPFRIPTERELSCAKKGNINIYRIMVELR